MLNYKIFILLLVFTLNLFANAQASLIADYHFDECSWNGTAGEVKDSSGSGFDGKAVTQGGDIPTTTDSTKIINRSGGFTTSKKQYVIVNNLNNFDKTSFSASLWVKANGNNIPAGTPENEKWHYWQSLLRKDGNQNWHSKGVFNIKYHNEWKYLRVYYTYTDGTHERLQIENVNLDGSWHHIVVTLENDMLKVYIDNVFKGSQAAFGNNLVTPNSKLHIGGLSPQDNQEPFYAQANIDEVKIYNGALTSSEITTIYNNENAGKNYNGTNRDPVNCSNINAMLLTIGDSYNHNKTNIYVFHADTSTDTITNFHLVKKIDKKFRSLAYRDGNFYTLDYADGQMYTINPLTGNYTVANPFGQITLPHEVTALSFDDDDNIILNTYPHSTPLDERILIYNTSTNTYSSTAVTEMDTYADGGIAYFGNGKLANSIQQGVRFFNDYVIGTKVQLHNGWDLYGGEYVGNNKAYFANAHHSKPYLFKLENNTWTKIYEYESDPSGNTGGLPVEALAVVHGSSTPPPPPPAQFCSTGTIEEVSISNGNFNTDLSNWNTSNYATGTSYNANGRYAYGWDSGELSQDINIESNLEYQLKFLGAYSVKKNGSSDSSDNTYKNQSVTASFSSGTTKKESVEHWIFDDNTLIEYTINLGNASSSNKLNIKAYAGDGDSFIKVDDFRLYKCRTSSPPPPPPADICEPPLGVDICKADSCFGDSCTTDTCSSNSCSANTCSQNTCSQNTCSGDTCSVDSCRSGCCGSSNVINGGSYDPCTGGYDSCRTDTCSSSCCSNTCSSSTCTTNTCSSNTCSQDSCISDTCSANSCSSDNNPPYDVPDFGEPYYAVAEVSDVDYAQPNIVHTKVSKKPESVNILPSSYKAVTCIKAKYKKVPGLCQNGPTGVKVCGNQENKFDKYIYETNGTMEIDSVYIKGLSPDQEIPINSISSIQNGVFGGRVYLMNFTPNKVSKDTYIDILGHSATKWDGTFDVITTKNPDKFAIRPDHFSIDLDGYDGVNNPLKAGENFHLKITAHDFLGGVATNFTELVVSNSDYKVEVTDKKYAGATNYGLELGGNSFVGGILDVSTTYNEVGELNITVDENIVHPYALIDKDDGTSLSDLKIELDSKELRIVPHHFDITSHSMKDHNPADKFTYYTKKIANISSKFDYNITAQNKTNGTTTRYTSGKYAKNGNIDLNLSATTSEAIYPFDMYWSRGTNLGNQPFNKSATNTLSIPFIESEFTDGVIGDTIKMNFKRAKNIAVEPLRLSADSLSIEDTTDNIYGTLPLVNEYAYFYYGRTHAPNYTTADNPFSAPIHNEVYCNNCTKSIFDISQGKSSVESIHWYINPKHTASDGQHTVFTSISNKVVVGANSLSSGQYTLQLSTPKAPAKSKISIMEQPSWMIYNRHDASATSNHFDISFTSGNSVWAGQGDRGNTVDTNISNMEIQSIEW